VRLRPALTAVVAGAAIALAGLTIHQIATWPDVPSLARANPASTAFIDRWRARQSAAGRPARPAWSPVPYARIAADLKLAVLVAEDIDFFTHDGFSRVELEKAISEAWEKGEAPRGASTLTQQLAKNLWLSPSRNPLRKVKEAILTRQLERHLGKRRILELYLNVVEFGPGIYGAEAAARAYFGIGAAALDRRQSASLAAGLPKPSTWHPGSKSPVYARRVARIESRIERAAWLRRQI
jgi:monofunctional biosynthetic peptidoglycan transglycosylase